MRVSIVTISFNQAPYLESSMRSVLHQAHDDLEYIVVDAGSTDGSQEIIDRYRDELAAVVLGPDEGPADGLNNGFGVSTGDVCAWLNADDILLPGAIAGAVAAFEHNPIVDVVYGDGYVIDEAGCVVRRVRSTPTFGARRYALGWSLILQQATFVRRSAIAAAEGFNVENRTNWDGEFFMRLALAGTRFQHVGKPWGCFRLHPDSVTGSDRFASEYAVTQRRLFRSVMGRDPNTTDRLLRALATPQKWIRDPISLYWRVGDELKLRTR